VLDATDLIDWARQRLAPYKVPRACMFVSDLPRNAMGKVTKPEIKAMFTAQAPGAAART
jgi:malonyl-CoA/methylmalonyl-CoA synthetase